MNTHDFSPKSGKQSITVPRLKRMKRTGERISMVTAYDFTFARLFDEAGIDVLLVGDSLGMVIQGHHSTLPVTIDEMIYHCRTVARGTQYAHIVGDMPFLSWQTSLEKALQHAGQILSKGGAHAVKIEGGIDAAETISRIVRAGIPVMGHIGLEPQSMHALGGFRVQGKTERAANRIFSDAFAVAEAGAYALVLESIPTDLAARITDAIDIPTIGIGAGPHCDGQVLVCYDLLGLTSDELQPKFVKRYAEFFKQGIAAAQRYRDEVRAGSFPSEEHSFSRVRKTPQDESVSLTLLRNRKNSPEETHR